MLEKSNFFFMKTLALPCSVQAGALGSTEQPCAAEVVMYRGKVKGGQVKGQDRKPGL
jgi:hypothetical protein